MASNDVETEDGPAPTAETSPVVAVRPRRRALRGSGELEPQAAPSPGARFAPSAWLLAVAVVGSVLAIGTVHIQVLAVVAALVFAAAALAIHRSAGARYGLPRSLPVITCGALVAYTLIQAVPLPMGVLRFVASSNADVWERALLPMGEAAPRWASISLDPGASVVEALKWSVYAAVFATSALIAARRGAAWGIALVFASAVAAALTTLGHGLASATTVFGLYQPAFRPLAWHVGPLLNPNNLAGYLNLGALCGLGILLMHRPPLPRWLTGVGVALIVGVEVTAASRGGVLALPIGVIALALMTRGRGASGRGASTWLIGATVAGGAALAVLGGTSAVWNELYDKSFSKLEMVAWARPLLEDHPVFGVGRGAFESVFPFYRAAPGNVVFTHAENFPVQWAAEWGLPVAALAMGAFGWAFWPTRLGAQRSALAAGAWAGVAVLLLQNLADLAMEVPGVCIAAATVLGALWGDSKRRSPRNTPSGTRASWLEEATSPAPASERAALGAALAAGGLGAALIAGALGLGWRDVAVDRSAIRASFEAASNAAASRAASNAAFAERAPALRRELRGAIARHPADPYFPLVGAQIAARVRDQSPIPWLQRALERGRTNGRAHLLLAEVLAGRATRKQALLELRLSIETDPALAGAAADLAVRWTKDFDDYLVAVPEGALGASVLFAIANRLGDPAHTELRRRCDEAAIARDPAFVPARVRQAEERVRALAKGSTSALCADRERCQKEILEHARALEKAEPGTSTALRLRARLMLAEGRPEEAVRLLDRACEQVTDRKACLEVRAQAASEVKAIEPLEAAAKALLGASCVSAEACADSASWLASLHAGRGEANTALALYKRAAREDPSEKRLEELANAAARVGSHALAEETLRKLLTKRGGADAALQRRIDEQHALSVGQAVAPTLPGDLPRR